MADLSELLKRWPDLPDEAIIPSKLTAAITGLSERTIRYDPRFERVYLMRGRYGHRAGNVCAVLNSLPKE